MSSLHVKPGRPSGAGPVISVTPESAGWRHVGFDLHRLKPGQTASGDTGDREVLLVLVEGRARIAAGSHDLGELGDRLDVFEKTPPAAAYVPAGTPWSAAATTDLTLAVCSAPGGGDHPVRAIRPAETPMEVRGRGTNERHIHPILMEDREWAASLLVTEVFTPSGHWSSYPPHRHDEDAFPRQTLLEETYYHRLDPASGFGFQRIYTDADARGLRDLDETIAFSDGDVTLVPRGYHPCAAPYGYDLYYLNVMAGPLRKWRFHNDPDHAWIFRRDSGK